MHPAPLLAVGFLAIGSGGCASIAGLASSPEQTLELAATDGQGGERVGLHCTLANDRGRWSVEVPGRVQVLRSPVALHIECTDPAGAGAADRAAADTVSGRGFSYPPRIELRWPALAD